MRKALRTIFVRVVVGDRARGRLTAGAMVLPCALGPTGIVVDKREGDGATPRGTLAVRRVWRRADRVPRPPSGAPVRTTRRDDGWCDAAAHPRYNQLIRLPFQASHETLWRDDGLYDLMVELGWNDRPVRRGRGSAIFLHTARPGFPPTAGCVAVAPHTLRRLAARIGRKTVLRIGAPTNSRPVRRGRRN